MQEYKKPEFKVKVTTPRAHVNVGEKTSFTVSARYFFGAPVARANVKYYVYRSRHYGWWDEGGEAEEDEFGADPSRDEDESSGYYGYDDNMMLEGEGKLDAQGQPQRRVHGAAGQRERDVGLPVPPRRAGH